MNALVFYAPRWEIYLRTNDMAPTFVLRYTQAVIWPKANSMHTPSWSAQSSISSSRYGSHSRCLLFIWQRLQQLGRSD
jgi:hypothetical protein